MDRVMKQLRTLQTDLQRYIQLTQILARNERLFYQLLMEYTEELMPIVYTPTVGLACQQYGLIFRDPRYGIKYKNSEIMFIITQYATFYLFFFRGLFITINDLGHVYDIVSNWPERRVQVLFIFLYVS